MPYFGVDDGFAFHRKTLKAGNAAIGLWTRAGAWSNHQLTDGFVPADMVDVLGTPAQAARLVKAGLWITVDGGYQFHQWAEEGRNFTREQVLAKRAAERDRKARSRSANSGEGQFNKGGPGRTPRGVRPESQRESQHSHPIPSHPIPDGGQVEGEGSPSDVVDSPRPSDRCEKHQGDPDPPACGGCADARRAVRTWEIQTEKRRKWIASEITLAMANPRKRCEHGTDGGLHMHPDTGQSATCALCRRGDLRSVS